MATSSSKSLNKGAGSKTAKTDRRPLRAPKILSRAKRAAQAEDVIKRLRKLNPHPKCELYYKTNFHLLVSVVLSAQTTDKMVNQCMQPLYDQGDFDCPHVLQLGAAGLLQQIKRIGLAPTKSKRVVELAGILLAKHGGEVPDNREDLEHLPGVGRKTANVILGELFGHPTIAVDTHVYRVTHRLGLHNESTPEKCEQVLLDLIDPKYLPAAHHWFILHGRYTCKAMRPACSECILKDICPSYPGG